MWFRVDNRLIHGQVIEGWLPYTGARALVVANDALAADFLRQQIMSLAVSRHIEVHFIPLTDLPAVLAACGDETFVLFENCQDVGAAADSGVRIPVLNIGNIHYTEGRHQIYPHVALSDQDMATLRSLVHTQHTELDFRAVPSQKMRPPHVQLF